MKLYWVGKVRSSLVCALSSTSYRKEVLSRNKEMAAAVTLYWGPERMALAPFGVPCCTPLIIIVTPSPSSPAKAATHGLAPIEYGGDLCRLWHNPTVSSVLSTSSGHEEEEGIP